MTIAYKRVSPNVYQSNKTYRVRYTVKGVRKSKCFSSKKMALEFRNKVAIY